MAIFLSTTGLEYLSTIIKESKGTLLSLSHSRLDSYVDVSRPVTTIISKHPGRPGVKHINRAFNRFQFQYYVGPVNQAEEIFILAVGKRK